MEKIRCSFCGKSQEQVRKLIAGPGGAYICDECVDICAEIIEEEFEDEPQQPKADFEINLQKPKKLNEILAANTGKSYEQIAADTERDNYMSAQEAVEYGLIDSIITNH